MTDEERKRHRTWLRINAFFHPMLAPDNVCVENLVYHWCSTHKEPGASDDKEHPIWALAREVAAETPPMVPYPPEIEASQKEMSALESRILHGLASEDEIARWRALKAPYDAIVKSELVAYKAHLIALGEDPTDAEFRKNLVDHSEWTPEVAALAEKTKQ